MILAQVQPLTFTQLGVTLAVLIAVSGFAANIAMLFNLRRTQKREVTFSQEFATKEEVASLVERISKVEDGVEGIRAEMKEDRDAILQAGERRAETIHSRINDVLTSVSELRGHIRSMRS